MSIAVRFTEEDLAAIDAALTQLEQRFSRLVALDAKERRRLYKMGNKTEKFCREALTVLDKNRQLASEPPRESRRLVGVSHAAMASSRCC